MTTARKYREWADTAQALGRPGAARKLRFLADHIDWRESRKTLGLVNGHPRLQALAMDRINHAAAQMRRSYKRARQ